MQTTRAANRLAARGHTFKIVRALKSLGMRRCSESLVRRQWDEAATQASWYCCFWRWFEALWLAHRAGAEFLYEDFRARVEALRQASAPAPALDWYEQLSVCAREQSEALQAAIRRHDVTAIRRELAESIAAERKLLAMLDRPARSSARQAA